MMVRLVQEVYVQRRSHLFFLAALLVIGVLIYYFRVSILQEQLISIRHEWAAERSHANKKTILGKAEIYEVGQRDMALFEQRIPKKNEFARVISELFEIAENNSITVGSVNYKPEKAIKGYIQYKINIDVSGGYGPIKSYLADISQAKDLITVDSVSLSKGGKVYDEEVTMRATLTVLFGAEG